MTNAEIETWFEQVVVGYMFADIEKSIKATADFGAALMLASYTEVIGGLSTGLLGEDRKSPVNFKAGLKLLDEGFRQYDPANYTQNYYGDFKVQLTDGNGTKSVDLYKVLRCGLVHEYFAKGFGDVVNDPNLAPHSEQGEYGVHGVGWHNGRFVIYNNIYYEHFKAAVAYLRAEIGANRLKAEFEQAWGSLARALAP